MANPNKDVYIRSLLVENIKLPANKINKQYKEVVLQELKSKVEGKCTKHGYIKQNSVEISSMQAGVVEMASLNGNMVFTVKFYADVCNPVVGSVVKCTVTNINNFGILAEVKPILEVIIAKNSVGIKSEVNLDEVQINDQVYVEVVGKKFELGDTRISIIGRIILQPSSIKNKKSLRMLQSAQIQADEDDAGDDDDDAVASLPEGEGEEGDEEDAEDDGEKEDQDESDVEENDEYENDNEDNDDDELPKKTIGGGFFESDQEEDEDYGMFGGEDDSDADGSGSGSDNEDG